MGRFAIVAYRPKPDREEQLLAAVKKHPRLAAPTPPSVGGAETK